MILILVASLNENMRLANTIKSVLDSRGVESKIVNLVELELPMYDSRKEQNDGIPQKAMELADTMRHATAYIFVSPEYNYCITPVLANAIAWISRIGDDFRSLFALKKVQLASFSGASGQDALNASRIQLTRLGATLMPREILATPKKELKASTLENILDQFVK